MDAQKIAQFEDALLAFVLRASKENANRKEMELLPRVADVLAGVLRENGQQ